MKVFDLCCAHGHGFEGWFGSDDDFRRQLDDGLLECPLCADRLITKRPSAPRLNLSGARESGAVRARDASVSAAPGPAADAAEGAGRSGSSEATPAPAALQAMWLQAVSHVLKNTEDVGERFPEEVRRIHYGEVEHRGIRGQATPEQRAELADEGIEVMALPLPAGLKGPVQ